MLVLLAIVGLCVLIIVHEGGHFVVARLCGMRVDRFSVGFGPPLVKFKRGETTYQISAIPFGGFVQIAGLNPGDENIRPDDPRSYPNRPVLQRLLTIFAGPGTNYLFAALFLAFFVYPLFGVPMPGKTPMIVQLAEGKPAMAAGLQPGDEVLSVNGKAVKDTSDVAPIVEEAQGAPVEVVVLRERARRTFSIKPEQIDGKWRIGIMIEPREVYVRTSFGKAIVAGFRYPHEFTLRVFGGLAAMFRGKEKPKLGGPVEIVRQMKGQLARGHAEGLQMMAALSVYLGLFNLFPLPALDGGRLIFLVIEGFSRRRVNQRIEQTVHLVGMFALLGLMLYITVMNDLGLGKLLR